MKTLTYLRLIFVAIWIFAFDSVFAQKMKTDLQIDSAFIYKHFDDHGTTAGLAWNHRQLDSTKHESTKLNSQDLETLQSFICNSKDKRLFQKKYGGQICYIVAYTDGQSRRFVAASTDSDFWLDNLDQMRYRHTNDQSQVERLNKMIKKYWR